ncbi:serine/threonine-protein kinase [Streptomyces sp. T-3]|nr:serine/threonine-protein kinase [Streptomyces sp. T-3]
MTPLAPDDPSQLGPYHLLGVLGDGGMGKVYLGQDGSGGTAAVKVLGPELSGDHAFAEHFVRGAQAARAVSSAGVARVLNAQSADAQSWIAAEFLAGPTLEQAVTAYGPLPEPAVRTMAAALARTLADIHEADLTHLDLNPSHIVLTSTGPLITGFGVPRPARDLALNALGDPLLSPGFSAPELVLGQQAGRPADVFSLGAVLAYATTGVPAYSGSEAAPVQHEVVYGEPQLSNIPADLKTLLTACLTKEPERRPTTDWIETATAPPPGAQGGWILGPWADYIAHRERTDHQPNPEPMPPPPTQRISRRRFLGTLAVGGTVLAASGGATAWWLQRRREPDIFSLPAAVQTPEARVLPMDKSSDGLEGTKVKPLWGPLSILGTDTGPPLPVRDVIVFGAKKGGLAAHSVVNGKHRWTAPEVDIRAGYLSLSDALLAAVDIRGNLVTFVASTGEPRWTAPAEARALLAADDESVYVVTKDGQLRSISRSDAKARWTVRCPATLDADRQPLGLAAHGRLLVPTAAGEAVVLDTAKGHKVWGIRAQSTSEMVIRPALKDGTVFLNGTSLTARRLTDGKTVWSARVGARTGQLKEGEEPVLWGPPTIRGNSVYATQGRDLCALDINRGTQNWNAYGPDADGSPVLPQGKGVWWFEATSDPGNSDRLGRVAVVDPKTSNNLVWTYDLKNKGKHWLMADGNRVFALDGSSLTALPIF